MTARTKSNEAVDASAAGRAAEMVATSVRFPADGMPLLLDAAGAAKLLDIGRSTFYRLDETGGVPSGVRLGRMRRWRSDELRAWIAAGCPPRVRWEELTR